MLNVKVLGFGCQRCQLIKQIAVDELAKVLYDTPDLTGTVEQVEDVQAIQKYHIFYMPGLVVNEKLVCAGRIPSHQEVLGWLRDAIAHQNAYEWHRF
jgi:hypothetical protein